MNKMRRLDDYYSEIASKDSPTGWNSTEDGVSAYLVIFMGLMTLVLILGKFHHDSPKLASILPQAGMIIIVGIVASGIVYIVAPSLVSNSDKFDYDGDVEDLTEGLLSFSPAFFFTLLLPPIIFNSGYHVNREILYLHIRAILLYSLPGTLINILATATILHYAVSWNLTGGFEPTFPELLTFGSLIASTDPVAILSIFQKKRVDPQVFYLVFGESVLNDGVCLVLFESFAMMVMKQDNSDPIGKAILSMLLTFFVSFLGSLFLGVFSGMIVALLLKHVDMRNTQLLELSLYVLVMYMPFFFADSIGLSGIVTILFTGMSAKRYAKPNLSEETKFEADVLFRITSHLAETAIFLELGLSLFGLGVSSFEGFYLHFIAWALFACLVGRACSIYPMTFISNMIVAYEGDKDDSSSLDYVSCMDEPEDKSDLKIHSNTAHMLWFSGLRGAVSYACSRMFPDENGNRHPFVVITMSIVLVTVFLLGGTSELVLDTLKIPTEIDENEHTMGKGEGVQNGILITLNEKYICPILIRDYKIEEKKEKTIMPTRAEMLSSSVAKSVLDLIQASSQEMTIDDHEKIVSEMEHRYLSLEEPRKSLYDFGEMSTSSMRYDPFHY